MPRSTDVQLTLRFNEQLRRQLERAARRNQRSLNNEIIYRLAYSLGKEAGAAAGQMVAELEKGLGRELTEDDRAKAALAILDDYLNRKLGEQS
jgi:hypothetical protein